MPSTTPEQRKLAAAMLGCGFGVEETATQVGVGRVTIWRWRKDPEFQGLVDAVVQVQVVEARQQLRDLAPLAIEAFRKGLGTTHKAQAMKVKTARSEQVVIAEVPDLSLAVHTADLVARRIPELAPHENVTIAGSLEQRLAELEGHEDAGASD